MKKITILLCMLLYVYGAWAQGFGRNKPRYTKMDFRVLETPTFEIYHYLENDRALEDFADWSEHWYKMHQAVLKDTFGEKNPIILYNNHADFQQTRAIEGMIGIGTGGVTEGLRNRVVLPFAMSNQQTHHVLGHELVHAFQYHLLLHSDTSLSIRNLQNVPLWMIEGMAEYLSIGKVDAHTAMWMRDAILQNDIPTIKDLSKPDYFPYRYGQAFWAFIAGAYGDTMIRPLLLYTAKYGMDAAFDSLLNVGEENLSSMWHGAMRTWYEPLMGNKQEASYGVKILDDENAGEMNISPALSPDGKYLIFLSEKDLFTTDLFLADAATGKIIRKVASTVRDGHLDNFDFIESTGTWSPDSRMYAFVAYKKGKNVLVIKEVANGQTVGEFPIPGVPAFSNPNWAPSGDLIVVSGLVHGQTDLYAYNWRSGEVIQLTNDLYSELHPRWSPDGSMLVFSTDQLSMVQGRSHGKWTFNLAIMDMDSRRIRHLPVFPGANNLNPVFDSHNHIWFLSNRDGFRNLYLYDLATGEVFQKTRLLTGISGITQYSPAISIAGADDRIVYTYYGDSKYTIFHAVPGDFLHERVALNAVNMRAATLPPVIAGQIDIVNTQLAFLDEMPYLPKSSLYERPYESKFELEYVGGGAGVGVGQQTFGTTTAMQGGVDFLFGDILGNRKLYTGLALNGEIYDFAGQAVYLNQKNRLGWGISLSHIPYRSVGIAFAGVDTLQLTQQTAILAGKYFVDNYRMFEEQASVFAQYPFSTTERLEGGFSYARIHYRLDRFTNYYDAFGQLIIQEREKLDAPPGFGYFTLNTAFVHDNSFFGIAAPLQGSRYRIGVEKYFGDLDFMGAIIDYRQYLYAKPFTFAFRATHLGRYGKDAEVLTPLYLGYPWFVRGYGFSHSDILEANKLSVNQLVGSKLLIANFEIRLPFTGPERLSVIKSKFLFTDLNLFVDGGLAWNDKLNPDSNERVGIFDNTPKPVFSTGASMRINLFGAMVLEPFLAVPLLKKTRTVFGVNVVPGW
ncbi:MAG: hypothetical protein D6730_06175 [Bacteroidetes bacterium]|nr:MAG: hypothetical protein D6730_06175 [Bacteroidota bacterium]